MKVWVWRLQQRGVVLGHPVRGRALPVLLTPAHSLPPQDFPSDWLAFYYPSTFRREKVVTYWQALATSDESWHMAPAEEQGLRECMHVVESGRARGGGQGVLSEAPPCRLHALARSLARCRQAASAAHSPAACPALSTPPS